MALLYMFRVTIIYYWHICQKIYNLSEPAYLLPYTAYVLLMMGEIVTRNM